MSVAAPVPESRLAKSKSPPYPNSNTAEKCSKRIAKGVPLRGRIRYSQLPQSTAVMTTVEDMTDTSPSYRKWQ